jgi:glutathione S-transferase
MKLYGALLSPFVRKVAVILAEKGLSYEMARGGPGSTDAEFLACSPLGKIPAIDDGGFQLADSTAIAVYLDARYSEPRLLPEDPQLRGKAVFWDEFADTVLAASGLKILFNRLVGPKLLKVGGDEAIALQGEVELPRWLDWLESNIPAQGWLLGETFSLSDIAVASVFRTLAYVGHGVDPAARPNTAAWYSRVVARPAWQAVAQQEEPIAQRILAM